MNQKTWDEKWDALELDFDHAVRTRTLTKFLNKPETIQRIDELDFITGEIVTN